MRCPPSTPVSSFQCVGADADPHQRGGAVPVRADVTHAISILTSRSSGSMSGHPTSPSRTASMNASSARTAAASTGPSEYSGSNSSSEPSRAGDPPYLSCIGLVTTASEVVQDLSGRGRDTGFGGDLLTAEGDRGGPQRPQRLHDLVDRQPGAGLGLARHRERGEHDGEVGFDAVA